MSQRLGKMFRYFYPGGHMMFISESTSRWHTGCLIKFLLTGLSTSAQPVLTMDPQQLRKELQEATTPDLQKRRGIIVASLAGIASMAAVTLLQTGIVKHLPDPPLGNFDSDNVNSSDTAYRFGLPDGPVSLAALALNIPIAAFGGANRPQKYPWLAIIAAGKAGIEAIAAGWYFYQMPKKEKAWCGYCIIGAITNFVIFGLTAAEAKQAVSQLTNKKP